MTSCDVNENGARLTKTVEQQMRPDAIVPAKVHAEQTAFTDKIYKMHPANRVLLARTAESTAAAQLIATGVKPDVLKY